MYKSIKGRPLEERMFIMILLFSITLSTILVLENILIGFPFVANYKWFLCISISSIFLYFTLQRKGILMIQTAQFCLYIFVLLPIGWLSAGANNNFTVAYAFLIYITINYLFDKKLRIILMVSEVAVVITMIIFKQLYPDLFINVSAEAHFIDSLVQVCITFLFAGLILNVFADAYKKEKRILDQYTQLLDEKNKELETLSMIDDLTQVYNRRYILNYISAYQGKQPFQLLLGMVDIDAFKTINDTYGHELGDQVIKYVSQELKCLLGHHVVLSSTMALTQSMRRYLELIRSSIM